MSASPPVASSRSWTLRGAWPLLVAALLFTLVWALPIVLGYFGMTDPALVYRTSPAERSSTPWGDQTPADKDTIATFARVMGAGLVAIALAGLALTWWPMVQGRRAAVIVAIAASGLVLGTAAYFHVNGYWNAWPLGVVVVAWIAGAVASIAWLVTHRSERVNIESRRRRAGRAS